MKKSIYWLAAFTLVLTGCKEDKRIIEPNPEGDEVVFSGSFTGSTSKTTLGDTELDLIPVLWTGGDQIGIFAASGNAVASNARATLTTGVGQRNANFTAMSVTLDENPSTFYLYYPYDKNATSADAGDGENPVRYAANGGDPRLMGSLPRAQSQPAANDFTHFSKYGYSVAVSDPAVKDQAAPVGFTMEHILTYLELSLFSTDATLDGFSVEEVTVKAPLSNPGDPVRLAGPFAGIFNYTLDADGDVVTYAPLSSADATNFSHEISLEIENLLPVTNAEASAQRFLVSMLPVDMTSKELTITLQLHKEGSAKRFYTTTVDGRNFKSDNLYRLKFDINAMTRIYPLRAAIIWDEGASITVTDVELVTGSQGTAHDNVANSYIINTPGIHSIPAKKADGSWVEGVDASEYNYIKFNVPAGKKGNAVIGFYRWDPHDLTGSSNVILYSWHLWFADPQEITFNGLQMLDLDLGATAKYVPNDVAYTIQDGHDAMGYYYQWGRKDLFPRADDATISKNRNDTADDLFNTSTNTRLVTMNTAVFGSGMKWGIVRTKQSYESSYGMPTYMIDGTRTGSSWWGSITEGHQNMPSYNNKMVTTWADFADPCPYGYHVSTPQELATIVNLPVTFGEYKNAGQPRGRLYSDGTTKHWMPASSYRDNEQGNIRTLGNNNLAWANETVPATARGTGAYGHTLGEQSRYSDTALGRISGARTIRCIKN